MQRYRFGIVLRSRSRSSRPADTDRWTRAAEPRYICALRCPLLNTPEDPRPYVGNEEQSKMETCAL